MKKPFFILMILVGGLFATTTVQGQTIAAPTFASAPTVQAPSPTNLPMSTVLKVLKLAAPMLNCTPEALVAEYMSSSCSVSRIGTTSNGGIIYRVIRTSGGVSILVLQDSL